MNAAPTKLQDVHVYPLTWPPGRVRTPESKRLKGKWAGLYQENAARLVDEATRCSILDHRLSTCMPPHSRATGFKMADPAAAFWFLQYQHDRWVLSVLASDRFTDLGQNIKAIELTLQRARFIGEYGVYSVTEAMQGAAYEALTYQPTARAWTEVLALDGIAPASPEDVGLAYRLLARRATADESKLLELNLAREQALKALGGS